MKQFRYVISNPAGSIRSELTDNNVNPYTIIPSWDYLNNHKPHHDKFMTELHDSLDIMTEMYSYAALKRHANMIINHTTLHRHNNGGDDTILEIVTLY